MLNENWQGNEDKDHTENNLLWRDGTQNLVLEENYFTISGTALREQCRFGVFSTDVMTKNR